MTEEKRKKIFLCSLGGLVSFLIMLLVALLLKGCALRPELVMETLAFLPIGGIVASLILLIFMPETKKSRSEPALYGSFISFFIMLATAALMEMKEAGVEAILNVLVREALFGLVAAVFGIAVFRFGFGLGDAEASH